MIKRVLVTLCAACLAASTASAQSAFVGQWQLVPSKSRLPDEMKITRVEGGGGRYAFDFGDGAVETIAVDGSEQPGISGTLLSVTPQAPDSWLVARKLGGRLLLTATWKLSNHDSTITDYFRGVEADGSTLSTDYIYQRTSAGSGFAADWQSVKETMNSPVLLEVKALQGGGLSFDNLTLVDPLSQRMKSLAFDSGAAPASAAPNAARSAAQGPSSSMRRVDERTVVITDRYNAKEIDTEEFALSADMKTLTMTVRVAGHGRPNVLVFERR